MSSQTVSTAKGIGEGGQGAGADERCPSRSDRRQQADDKRDDLNDADRLAPFAWKQRVVERGQRDRGGEKRIAHRADGEHPGTDLVELPDEARQNQNEKGVGFHVEPRAEGARGSGPAREPAVDAVQDEGGAGKGGKPPSERGGGVAMEQKARAQGGDRGAHQGYAVGRAQAVLRVKVLLQNDNAEDQRREHGAGLQTDRTWYAGHDGGDDEQAACHRYVRNEA